MDYEKIKQDWIFKNQGKCHSIEDLGQPTNPIKIDKFSDTIEIDYNERGTLKLWLNDLDKKPKTIYDVGLLFLYLTTGKRQSGFNREIDEPRLKEMIENIITAEIGTYKRVLVFEELN